MQWQIVASGLLGLAFVLSVSVYAYLRLRVERERTLQKLVERGLTGDDLIRAAGLDRSRRSDLRRGLLLIGVALAWSSVTFLVGGPAWKMGGAPLAIGLVYLLLWTLDGRPR
jgi:hypothetical protein